MVLEQLNISVQFGHSVMPDSLQPYGLQHTRLPCPSQTPEACSNSCPLSRWCHPTISTSVVPFSSCFQFSPASESFPMSLFFESGGYTIGVSASASGVGARLKLLWCWTVCLGNELRSFCYVSRLHPSTAFWTLLLIMKATPFPLRDSCPQFSSV